VTRGGDRRHHAIRSDGDEAIDRFQRHHPIAELLALVSENGLDDVAAKMSVLRPPRLDGRAHAGAPDHLIGRPFDLLALEEILAFLVAGEVDHAIAVLAHRLGYLEEHGVT